LHYYAAEMALPSRFSRLLPAFASLLLFAAPMAQAQTDPLPPPTTIDREDPWIYRGTDIPRDDQWLFGQLPNGLRYAVRSNGVPPGQASIRISIGTGVLNEEEGERGYAHLIEHLSFRESKYLGNAEAIPTWQRLGARLGDETNAQTTPTQTVYMLDLPNANRTNIEETVKLLSGMIREPALSTANITDEVPIVLSEMRDGGGAAKRVSDTITDLFYRGQRLGNRTSEGVTDDLKAATSEGLKAFHHRWYRPDNAVVVIVGDGPATQYASLIERYFSDWQVEGELPPQPDFGKPVAPPGVDPANPVGETAVQVEPDLPRALTWGIFRPWVQVTDNLEFNRERMISVVAEQILNQRLKDRGRDGGRYIFAQVQQSDVSRTANVTLVAVGPRDEDWKGALEDARGVIADAMANPPSEEEIASEVAAIDLSLQDGVTQAINRTSPDLADEVIQAVDIRESVASAQTFLDVFRGMRDRFTPEALLEHTRQMFAGTVSRLHYITPAIGEAKSEDLQLALLDPVAGDPSARLAGNSASFDNLPPVGAPAQPTSEEPLGINDIGVVTFANGVKALLRRSENEPGRVTVRVRFGSGMRAFSQADAPYIPLGQMALIVSGFADVGPAELDQLLKGRKLGFGFDIGDGTFQFEAETRAEDLADQLYLFAAKLGMPRWDAEPFDRAKSLLKLDYQSYSTDPMGVIDRDLEFVLSDADKRFAMPTPDQIDATSLEGFRKVWEPLLGQGPVEVMVFGDIDQAAALEALSQTFGALPARTPIPADAGARNVAFPAAQSAPRILFHRGEADQAAAVVAWKLGGGSQGIPEGRQIEVLAEIFSNRLLDAMREKAGASYSPFVISDWPADTDSGGRMTAVAQLSPEAVPGFFEVVDQIAADLIAHGPNQDELQRVTEPYLQFLNRAMYGSRFWMNRVEGATTDPQRLATLGSIVSDYTLVTPERLQELAQRYLSPGGEYRVGVIPEGQQLASMPPDRPATP
jgi:zinc protease